MTPEQRVEEAEAKLLVAPELLDRLVERANAWGECPSEWLTRAVQHVLSERPEPLPLPPPELPLLAYGALQPGELAHQQVAALVARAVDASVENHVIRTRDGLPLLVAGSGRAFGTLLWFTNSTAAYDTVRVFEPSRQYRWAQLDVDADGQRVTANVLLPRTPEKGSDAEVLERWTGVDDPVMGHGLAIAGLLAADPCRRDLHLPGWSWKFSLPFFQMQAAYLLAMTVAERYTALAFGPGLAPTERIRRLEASMLFAECLAEAHVRTGRRVVDSRDPADQVNIGDNGERAWSYWYQVRSNLSHRGKGAAHDAHIVREAVIDVHDVLRILLRRELPGIERAWTEADPDGARHVGSSVRVEEESGECTQPTKAVQASECVPHRRVLGTGGVRGRAGCFARTVDGQLTVPALTIHSTGCPVTAAMRSKSWS